MANDADQQKRSGDALLRKTSIMTGISEPFDLCNEPILVCGIALRVVQGREVSLQGL